MMAIGSKGKVRYAGGRREMATVIESVEHEDGSLRVVMQTSSGRLIEMRGKPKAEAIAESAE